MQINSLSIQQSDILKEKIQLSLKLCPKQKCPGIFFKAKCPGIY